MFTSTIIVVQGEEQEAIEVYADETKTQTVAFCFTEEDAERIANLFKKDNMETTTEKMTVKEALELILENSNCPALNYAVGYAKYALGLESDGQLAELRIQLLYVVSNLGRWRTSKAFQVTDAEIKECRAVLRAACK